LYYISIHCINPAFAAKRNKPLFVEGRSLSSEQINQILRHVGKWATFANARKIL